MGFLSQGVPNLVPWLIFRAWRGGRWDFRLWPFLGRFFGFCTEKLRFFGFDVRCSFWFFGFLAPAFLAKIKHVTDFSLCCESVQSDNKEHCIVLYCIERSTRAAKTRSISLFPPLISRGFRTFISFIRSAWFSPLSWSLEQARFTTIESFLRTQNCPHCPLLLSNRGSLWILVDNPRADMPVLWP